MSSKPKDVLTDLLKKASSQEDSVAFRALQKLSKTKLPNELIIEAKVTSVLRDICHKRNNDDIGSEALRIAVKWQNNLHRNKSSLDSTKQHSIKFDKLYISHNHTQKQNMVNHSDSHKIGEQINEIKQLNLKPKHVREKVFIDKDNHHSFSKVDLWNQFHSLKESHLPYVSNSAMTHERKELKSDVSYNVEKIPPDQLKKSAHDSTISSDFKYSSIENHKNSSNSKYGSSTNYDNLSRKTSSKNNVIRESFSSILNNSHHLNDSSQENGFSGDCLRNSSQRHTAANQINMNGHSNLETNAFSHYKKSSLPQENHVVGPECNNKPTYFPKSVSSHGRESNFEKYQPHKLHLKSPEKSQHSKQRSPCVISQNNNTYKSPCRPDQLTSSEYSNKDRPLLDESNNLLIDTTEVSGVPSSEQHQKTRSPYSVQLREGMFRVVKVGPEQEMLKVRELKHIGTGGLKDGAFSWGWSIEKRNPSLQSVSKISPSKGRGLSPSLKDINKCKRKIDYNKMESAALDSKKHQSSKDQEIHKEKSFSLNGESKPEKRPKTSADVRRTSSLNHVEKVKTNFSIERKKSPIHVPSSDGRIPTLDCDAKSSKVIDDSTMSFISSKKERKSIYSGKKIAHDITTLKKLCYEVLKKNIMFVRISDSVPIDILKPVLEMCSPAKLYKIECQNKHLSKCTDTIWKKFCRMEFRDQHPIEKECWKDVYWRAWSKREKKLKSLTASISNGMSKAVPERQAKFMGVDSYNPEKRPKKMKIEEQPASVKTEVNGKGKECPKSSESESSNSPPFSQKASKVSKPVKKTVAPLMSKTKKMLNMVNRRR